MVLVKDWKKAVLVYQLFFLFTLKVASAQFWERWVFTEASKSLFRGRGGAVKLEDAFCEDLYETCSSRLLLQGKGNAERVLLDYFSSIHGGKEMCVNVCT